MVYCIGNNNYDIFFEDDRLASGAPGGSMLNVAVSLGRMNTDVQLVTTLGNDALGNMVLRFLKENYVGTDFVQISQAKQTSLAVAFLDETKKPVYTFYGETKTAEQPLRPSMKQGDILLYGSSFAIHPNTAPEVDEMIEYAQQAEAIKVYDPNIRRKCAFQVEGAYEKAMQRIAQADIVKLSDEDSRALGVSAEQISKKFPEKIMVMTQGKHPVIFMYRGEKQEIPVKAVEPVNTTGAGDAFNAGLIQALEEERIQPHEFYGKTFEFWRYALLKGVEAAAKVCQSAENYVPN